MRVVDTSTWKPFRVEDLFGGIYNAHAYHAIDLSFCDDCASDVYEYVCRSCVNNAVQGYVLKDSDRYVSQSANTICFGAETVYFTYHSVEYLTGNKMYWFAFDTCDSYLSYLQSNKHVNSQAVGLFLCSALNAQLHDRFSYNNGLTASRFRKQVVHLPATPDGKPDWAYMETYMQQVLDREEMFAEHLASLTAEAVADGHVIDTSSWKAFRVGDLFDIHPTCAYKMTNNVLMDGGCTPVVVNSAMNNGIGGFTTQAATESGRIITFSDTTTGDAIFYQSEPFVGYPHVQGMYPHGDYANCWSDFSLMFFTVAFRAVAMACAFDYSNKFRRDVAVDMNVKLPVTSDGIPDWAYMEQYMKDVMTVEALFADELDRVYCS